MAFPTVEEMVYDRAVYLATSVETSALILRKKLEFFFELQRPFGKIEDTDEQVEDEANYRPLQLSLVSDMVAYTLLRRKALENTEGASGGTASGNRMIKKGKAGETEAEFESLKANDGARVMLNAKEILSGLKSDAIRKAAQLGFILDIQESGAALISSFSQGSFISNESWED